MNECVESYEDTNELVGTDVVPKKKTEIALRDYQKEAIDAILDEWNSGKRRTLVVLPTGSGKTLIFLTIAVKFTKQNKQNVLILVHREELLRQPAQRLKDLWNIYPLIERAEDTALSKTGDLFYNGSDGRIVISTVQTISRPSRLARFAQDMFGLVIVDEAHHSVADTWQRVINYFTNAKMLGVTATPDRSDEIALGTVWDSCAYEYEILDAIQDGYLVPITQYCFTVDDLDLSRCTKNAGDLSADSLECLLTEHDALAEIVRHTRNVVGTEKTIVFCPTKKIARLVAEMFNSADHQSAEAITDDIPREIRNEIYKVFESKDKPYVLCSVDVLTEGWDCPKVKNIVIARPTLSRLKYAQMIGRGTRPLPGVIDNIESAEQRISAIAQSEKPKLTVIDFADVSKKHKLIRAVDVLAGKIPDDVIDIARQQSEEKGHIGADVLEEIKEAERKKQEIIKSKIKAVAERMYKQAERKAHIVEQVDPFTRACVALNIPQFRPRKYDAKATQRQLEVLHKWGIQSPDWLGKQDASRIISSLIKRAQMGLCTPKQAMVLQKFGYDPTHITKEEASKILTELQKNGWRRK